MDRESLAGKLRALREGSGQHQAAVALEAGVHASTLSRLEDALVRRPCIFDIHRLAAYYGVSLDSLAEDTGTPKLLSIEERRKVQAVQQAIALLTKVVGPAPVNTAKHDGADPDVDPTANYVLTESRELAVAR